MRFRSLLLLLLVAGISPAEAQTSGSIGVAAPTSGPNAMLGRQVVRGARQATTDSSIAVTPADTECTAEGGRKAAEALAAAKVEIVVGFICTESLEAALPVLRTAGIPVIDIGVRADRFTAQRHKTGNLVWRVAPAADAEAKALTALVVSRWRTVPFGILDDGSTQNRALADAVRAGVEAAGLRAATIDTYRPAEEKQFAVARRLARTGVTHFVIAGERADAATIARDAAASGLAMEIAGGEALSDEPPDGADVPEGTLAVAPRAGLADEASSGDADDPETQGYFGPAHAAMQIAANAVLEAHKGKLGIADALNANEFATALGPVRFDAKGDADLDLFRVLRFTGGDFVPETGG